MVLHGCFNMHFPDDYRFGTSFDVLSGHLHVLICGVLIPIFSAMVLKLLHGTHIVQGLGLGASMVGGLGFCLRVF